MRIGSVKVASWRMPALSGVGMVEVAQMRDDVLEDGWRGERSGEWGNALEQTSSVLEGSRPAVG
jgi:hypothetical protein